MAIIDSSIFGGSALVGPIVCDAVLRVGRSQQVVFSKERIASGATASDHSVSQAKRYTLEGVVTNLPTSSLAAFVQGGLKGLGQSLAQQARQIGDSVSPVSIGLNTRSRDARAEVTAMVDAREPFVFASEEGEIVLVAEGHTNEDSFEVGDSYQFSLECEEVQVANGSLLGGATELSTNLVGSGAGVAKGATRTMAGTVDF